jgi:hypothetical protein
LVHARLADGTLVDLLMDGQNPIPVGSMRSAMPVAGRWHAFDADGKRIAAG